MVPDACDTRLDLHRLTRNDHTYWGTQHASHIEAWYQWRWMICFIGDTLCSRRKCRQLFGDAWSLSAVPWAALNHSTISSRCSLFNRHVAVPGSTFLLMELRGALADNLVVEQPVDALLYCLFPHRQEHVDPGHVEVERGEGSGGGQPTVDPFDIPNLDIPSCSLGLTPASQSLPSGSGTSFRAPPPPGIAGSSILHQPISHASSSDEEERTDDIDDVQHYGFEHRVGKKTTRFTPFD
ncbi:hypothetical protein M9H77_04879 [Catharanthus roseus]|uniref:Uncharacterized protein n=1 Tax=Catharanthus roseus TaxID=4058 RepID=A0ACC0CFW4_CATRO|nr:hypothetical protein M9H77_04879 [Catharanthus roseus]